MALATEILAVNSAIAALGDMSEQKTMLLDAELVQRARASVAYAGPAHGCRTGSLREA